MKLDPTMFREYDIRGLVNARQLNDTSVYYLGLGIGTFLRQKGQKKVVIGHDSRASSERFKLILFKGLQESGLDLYDIGLCLVPMFYYSQYFLKTKGGVYISASHNPGNWNGFKIADDYSSTLLRDDLKNIYDIISGENFIKEERNTSVTKIDIFPSYQEQLLKKIKINKKIKVVVDAGNGTAGLFVPDIFTKAGFGVVKLFCELDPSFPNHDPNPSAPENKEVLAKKVVDENADIGFAFDTDGDRLGVVDENGKIVEADQYLILLAREILSNNKGAKIVFDVKATRALADDIKLHEGVPIMWKTGHSYIKAKMRDENALLAGEVSGHVFYAENYGFDDAIFAGMKLASFLSSSDISFSKLMETVPRYISTPTLNANCPDLVKYKIVDELTKEFQKQYTVNTINGARVEFEDGWGLVRASSNLPVLVLRFEAKDEISLQKIIKTFKDKMSKYQEIDMNWYNG